MPKSKPRKKAAPRKNPNAAVPRRSPVPRVEVVEDVPVEKPSRDPARPRPPEELYEPYELPEPASYEAVLVALADMDPLAQEVMLAQRLAVMPHPGDGEAMMPVPIMRRARAPWAHHLRKLGVFCIPELATHELVSAERADGGLVNHTAMSTRRIDDNDIWRMAKEQNPDLGALVDNADTPEKKQEAMAILAKKLPVEQRIAMQRLSRTTPEEMEPR